MRDLGSPCCGVCALPVRGLGSPDAGFGVLLVQSLDSPGVGFGLSPCGIWGFLSAVWASFGAAFGAAPVQGSDPTLQGLELFQCRIWPLLLKSFSSPSAAFGAVPVWGSVFLLAGFGALSVRHSLSPGADFGARHHPDPRPPSHPMAAPGAGSCWQDPLAVEGAMCRPVCGTRCGRALNVVCVPSCRPAPCPALRCLRAACRQLRGRLRTVPFGRLALGDTAALESFYNAGEEEKSPRARLGASVSPLGALLDAVPPGRRGRGGAERCRLSALALLPPGGP